MRQTLEEVISELYYKATDPNMDGFSQFVNKQKLYEIKWQVDNLLPKISKFYGEEEFIEKNRRKYEF